MVDSCQDNTLKSFSLWQWIFRRPLPLERETSLFIVVNALDIFMTHHLLTAHQAMNADVIFYESNPVARFFLDGWGVPGIVYFKFAMVALVTVIAQIIALKQAHTARRLLTFATLMVGAVVVYSLSFIH